MYVGTVHCNSLSRGVGRSGNALTHTYTTNSSTFFYTATSTGHVCQKKKNKVSKEVSK